MSGRPVSKRCPQCGGSEYKRRKPQGWMAFTSDRECTACGTRYTPPTPVWAALVFLLAGVPMLLGGGAVVVFAAGAEVPNPCGMAFWGVIAAVGGLAVWHGGQALFSPGKV